MACKCCQKVVSDNDRIICRGFCGASFHAICVQLDFPLSVLRSNEKNIYWMCDDCSMMFANCQFRSFLCRNDQNLIGLPDSIKSIQDDITKLSSAVTTLAAKVESKPLTPFRLNSSGSSFNNWPRNMSVNTPKRRRYENGDPQVSTAVTKPSCGTKAALACSTIRLVKTSSDLVWIHLSAFHPTTTEQEICDMVCDCLHLTADQKPKVVKLVPKGIDLSTLNFVSFKVGVDKNLEKEALSSESWPENVFFRRFEDGRSKNVTRIVKSIPEEPQNPPIHPVNTSGTDPVCPTSS